MEELLHQGRCFLLSIGCGAFLTVCYLGFSWLRNLAGIRPKAGRALHGRKAVLLAAGDILFWILAALFCFLLIFRENQGEVRSYMLLGGTLGTFFVLFIPKGLKKFFRRGTIRQ